MFFHRQELQYTATPDKPDAVYARKLQEVLGGQYGEITVAMQYMSSFVGNMRMPPSSTGAITAPSASTPLK